MADPVYISNVRVERKMALLSYRRVRLRSSTVIARCLLEVRRRTRPTVCFGTG